jgi:hypothetical protein
MSVSSRFRAGLPLVPSAVRADGRPSVAPGRYRGAVFAGDNPYSCLVWVSLRTRSQPGPAIADAVAAAPYVRRGFPLEVGHHRAGLPGAA